MILRVALLHLELSGGPESDNLMAIESAIRIAAVHGVNWVVTPETAVQGYFFAGKVGTRNIPVQPSANLQGLIQLANKEKLTVFLGCAEQDAMTEKYYNSCLVIGPEGEIVGRHRKLRAHGDIESWSTKGESLETIACQDMTVGVLICADSWYVNHAQILKDKGAQAIVVPAAWPPGACSPGDCWEKCSAATGLPVWVCNQTGNQENMDFSQAQSVVVSDGQTQLSYRGLQQAVLLFDWDETERKLLSKDFIVLQVGKT
jgi:predicted amidohydrolase